MTKPTAARPWRRRAPHTQGKPQPTAGHSATNHGRRCRERNIFTANRTDFQTLATEDNMSSTRSMCEFLQLSVAGRQRQRLQLFN